LILLEQKTGADVQYRVMPPLTVPFPDHLAIQRIARQIADFIGLTDLTFIVAVAKQKEKVAGHIDLSTDEKGVFVEVDEETMKFPDAVAATLCHEACHKWLQINGLALPIESEDEILTDITSVFLGFGKIMLNGCKATNLRYETVPNGTRTITETKSVGYLDRDQLAFVYRLVCAMRNIVPSDFMQGLNAEAASAVQRCDASLAHHYDARFHRPETTQENVEAFHKRTVDLQYSMADLDKHATYIKKCLSETTDPFLTSGHRKLKSLRDKVAAMAQETEADPVLRFLRNMQREFAVERLTEELHSVGRESGALLQHARAVGRHFFRNGSRFPKPTPVMFMIVTCPQDGTKLRLPENSGDLIATCPTCKYRFAYNTTVPEFPEPVPTTPVTPPRRKTWFARLFRR
jgi:hypothetical protein